MKPTGGAPSATSADPDTNRLTGDSYQDTNATTAGHPQEGYAKVVAVNEQEAISESTNTTTTITSSPEATTGAVQSAVEAVGSAVEGDKDKEKEGTEEEASEHHHQGRPQWRRSNENPA